jgi:hypothetical protein
MSGRGEDKPNHVQDDHKRKQFPNNEASKIRNTAGRLADMIDTDLYVLNHSDHKIHLDTFFVGGSDGVALLTGTTLEEMTTGGLTFPSSTTFSTIDPGAEAVVGLE